MRPRAKKSSTVRRQDLADFIDSRGKEMVRKCSRCRSSGKACRVHLRSGMCSNCVRRNYTDCDVRVTEAEWERLRAERKRLTQELEAAREESNKAMSREMRLRRQLDQLEEREAEAISVEERDIQEQEVEEGQGLLEPLHPPENPGPDLAMSPWTWSILEGIPDDMWEIPEVPDSQPVAT